MFRRTSLKSLGAGFSRFRRFMKPVQLIMGNLLARMTTYCLLPRSYIYASMPSAQTELSHSLARQNRGLQP